MSFFYMADDKLKFTGLRCRRWTDMIECQDVLLDSRRDTNVHSATQIWFFLKSLAEFKFCFFDFMIFYDLKNLAGDNFLIFRHRSS